MTSGCVQIRLHDCMRASTAAMAGIYLHVEGPVNRLRAKFLRLDKACSILPSTPQPDRVKTICCHAGFPE